MINDINHDKLHWVLCDLKYLINHFEDYDAKGYLESMVENLEDYLEVNND